MQLQKRFQFIVTLCNPHACMTSGCYSWLTSFTRSFLRIFLHVFPWLYVCMNISMTSVVTVLRLLLKNQFKKMFVFISISQTFTMWQNLTSYFNFQSSDFFITKYQFRHGPIFCYWNLLITSFLEHFVFINDVWLLMAHFESHLEQ